MGRLAASPLPSGMRQSFHRRADRRHYARGVVLVFGDRVGELLSQFFITLLGKSRWQTCRYKRCVECENDNCSMRSRERVGSSHLVLLAKDDLELHDGSPITLARWMKRVVKSLCRRAVKQFTLPDLKSSSDSTATLLSFISFHCLELNVGSDAVRLTLFRLSSRH